MIFSQVTLLRPGEYVHLPYYRKILLYYTKFKNYSDLIGHNVQQPFKLTALGGSNHYEWVSRDLNIAVISQEGVILPKNLGSTVNLTFPLNFPQGSMILDHRSPRSTKLFEL